MSDETDDTRSFDPTIQSEDIGFKAHEMARCKGCGRSNPPNRLDCMYCGRELEGVPGDAASIRLTPRRLEAWERGFNVILGPPRSADDGEIRRAAAFLNFENAAFREIIDAGVSLPVARVESEKQAQAIRAALGQMHFNSMIVSDSDLAIDTPQVRLSGMVFTGQNLSVINFNTNAKIEIGWNEIVLLVIGVLTRGRVDALEKKRRHGKTKLVDETATSSDEQILDIYTRDRAIGYRVHQAGFDFSCLDDDKDLLASENMRLLVDKIGRNAPKAAIINSYGNIRRLLDDIWEIESRKDFQGLRRSGFGKVEFGSAVSTSNLSQFNKFSRLQWFLETRQKFG